MYQALLGIIIGLKDKRFKCSKNRLREEEKEESLSLSYTYGPHAAYESKKMGQEEKGSTHLRRRRGMVVCVYICAVGRLSLSLSLSVCLCIHTV